MRFRPFLLAAMLCMLFGAGGWPARAQDADETTITVPQSEWEALKARLEALEQEVQALKAGPAPAQPIEAPATEPGAEAAVPTPTSQAQASEGGRSLALPDISLIVQAKGKVSTDSRDEARDRIRLMEAELGIQGYVYPNVKADAFIAMSPAEEASAQAEEAYLTFLGVREGLSVYLGKKLVPFGRTNLLHCHSLPYVRRPLVLQDLVGEEGLSGQGVGASYVLPTQGELFAQLDLGTWTGGESGEASELPEILRGPGAGFADRYNTARLWTSLPVAEQREFELGASYARGPASLISAEEEGHVALSGLDVSYRHFGKGQRRLLLRGEGIWRRESGPLTSSTALGYYLFGDYRMSKYHSFGLLYDRSELPQAPGLHETALSAIFTHQFSEQYYLRLQGTHGSRPGEGSYNELWLQWVWGVGPHTHSLE